MDLWLPNAPAEFPVWPCVDVCLTKALGARSSRSLHCCTGGGAPRGHFSTAQPRQHPARQAMF